MDTLEGASFDPSPAHVMASSPASRNPEDAWYADLRRAWRPEAVRLLLVAESAPDPKSATRRFFYAPQLSQHDNLFRGVVEALYAVSRARRATRRDRGSNASDETVCSSRTSCPTP